MKIGLARKLLNYESQVKHFKKISKSSNVAIEKVSPWRAWALICHLKLNQGNYIYIKTLLKQNEHNNTI